MTGSCTTIQTSLESFAEQGLKQAAVDWQKELAHASDRVGEFTLAHKDKLVQAEKTVDNYVTKELLQDIPTGKSNLCYLLCWSKECLSSVGMTPQRHQFHYPSDLTRTRPHPELLEEFRSAREAAMTLPQLPESDSELETSSTSVSTMMLCTTPVLWQECMSRPKGGKGASDFRRVLLLHPKGGSYTPGCGNTNLDYGMPHFDSKGY